MAELLQEYYGPTGDGKSQSFLPFQVNLNSVVGKCKKFLVIAQDDSVKYEYYKLLMRSSFFGFLSRKADNIKVFETGFYLGKVDRTLLKGRLTDELIKFLNNSTEETNIIVDDADILLFHNEKLMEALSNAKARILTLVSSSCPADFNVRSRQLVGV